MEAAEKQPAVSRNKAIFKATILLTFVVGAIVLVRFTPVKDYLTAHQLGNFLDAAGFWAPLVFIVIYTAGVCLFLLHSKDPQADPWRSGIEPIRPCCSACDPGPAGIVMRPIVLRPG
jgi:hypothetical protein